jgi:hypothetical protein
MHYTPPPRDPKSPPVRINLWSETHAKADDEQIDGHT